MQMLIRKETLLIAIVVVCIGLSSCDDYHADRVMDDMEAWMDTYPDSARTLLEDLDIRYLMGEKTSARRCMMLGRVRDEQQKTKRASNPLSTEKWLKAQAYYDRYGTAAERAYIRLYTGRSQKDDGDYDDAADTYKEALLLAESTDDYSLSGYLSSYLGDLYLQRELYEQAREKYTEAADYHTQSGNLRSQALALRDAGYCELSRQEIQKGLQFFLQADSLIRIIKDTVVLSSIVNSFGVAYELMGELDVAERYYLEAIALDPGDSPPVYYALSDIYIKRKDYETARYYLEKAQSDHTKDEILRQYFFIEKAENNPDKAIEYLEQYIAYLDSVYAEQNRINVYEVERRYDKTRLENENTLLRIRTLRFTFISVMFFIALLVGLFFFRHLKNQKIRKQQDALRLMENEYRVLSGRLREKEKALSEQKKQEADYMQTKEKVRELGRSLSAMKRQTLCATTVAKKITHIINEGAQPRNNPLTAKDWKMLEEHVRLLYPSVYAFFQERIMAEKSEIYLRLCLLSFFDPDTKVEAFLLNLTDDNAARQWRFRLRKYLGIEGKQSIARFLTDFDEREARPTLPRMD